MGLTIGDPGNTSVGGYQCSNCDEWVSNGRAHYCAGPPYSITFNPSWGDDRVAVALERIASALERLIDKQGGL